MRRNAQASPYPWQMHAIATPSTTSVLLHHMASHQWYRNATVQSQSELLPSMFRIRSRTPIWSDPFVLLRRVSKLYLRHYFLFVTVLHILNPKCTFLYEVLEQCTCEMWSNSILYIYFYTTNRYYLVVWKILYVGLPLHESPPVLFEIYSTCWSIRVYSMKSLICVISAFRLILLLINMQIYISLLRRKCKPKQTIKSISHSLSSRRR